MLTPRQERILGEVVARYGRTGSPVGSKTLAQQADLGFGPSTIRGELAALEERGLLAHPHTSAGRVPTDSGHRYYVDHLLSPAPRPAGGVGVLAPAIELQLARREVDEALRATTETLAQVTDLLAVVSAPPVDVATIRHVELLLLQPQVAMVVVITSTGGVTKRVIAFGEPVDEGLVGWARDYLEERLVGIGLGARALRQRLLGEPLGPRERAFLEALRPAFDEVSAEAQDALYVHGAAALVHADRLGDLGRITGLMQELERRATLLGLLREALGEREVVVRIGAENELPALSTLSLVAAGYGTARRRLGTVSVIGPVRMDYAHVIDVVRDTAAQLSRHIEDVYAD